MEFFKAHGILTRKKTYKKKKNQDSHFYVVKI